MPRFLAPITVANETVTGSETISGNQIILSGTYGRDSYWTSVSASGGLSASSGNFINNVSANAFYGDGSKLTGITIGNYLSSTGGTLTGGLTGTTALFNISISSASISGVYYGDGSNLTNLNLTNLNASNITSGTLSAARLPAFTGDITTNAGSSSATVVNIQGYPISTQTPAIGQILQWSGTAYTPGAIPNGGSGGGGVTYFLNYGLSADNPVDGLSGTHYELGRYTTNTLVSSVLNNVSQTNWDSIATFVTDRLDPDIVTIPAGIFDLNFWASSDASIQTQMMVRYELYTYHESTSSTTLIATSDTYNIYDPSVVAQYVLSMIVPQTTIDINDRLFLNLQAKAASPNKSITVYYNDGRPTHLHTTIPSVGGTGLVKVINGVYQSPASLLVDADVASNAQINQTKIAGLTAALDSKFDKAGGTITDGITAASGYFTGNVYGSTATAGASSNQLATTAFVQNNLTTGLTSGNAIASTVVAIVTNDDTVPLTRGTVVYSYGSQGDRVSVRMASASAEYSSSKTLGFVNSTIAVGQSGTVTLYGEMDKLNFDSPFVAGDALWLGTTPGTYTRVKPQSPTHLVYLGVVQRANAGNGTAYIKVQNGYELEELHNVRIINPLSGQIIRIDSSGYQWVNVTPLFVDSEIYSSGIWNSVYTTVSSNSGKWESVYLTTNNLSSNWNSTVNTVSGLSSNWQSVYASVSSTSGNWNTVYNTVCGTSAKLESVYNNVSSNSATYATLTGTQTLKNKTVVDWMTLVRGYNTIPTLLATIGTGDVYTYVYNSSPSNITYYRFISTDGSTDAFYSYFSGTSLSGLVASKSITI